MQSINKYNVNRLRANDVLKSVLKVLVRKTGKFLWTKTLQQQFCLKFNTKVKETPDVFTILSYDIKTLRLCTDSLTVISTENNCV